MFEDGRALITLVLEARIDAIAAGYEGDPRSAASRSSTGLRRVHGRQGLAIVHHEHCRTQRHRQRSDGLPPSGTWSCFTSVVVAFTARPIAAASWRSSTWSPCRSFSARTSTTPAAPAVICSIIQGVALGLPTKPSALSLLCSGSARRFVLLARCRSRPDLLGPFYLEPDREYMAGVTRRREEKRRRGSGAPSGPAAD